MRVKEKMEKLTACAPGGKMQMEKNGDRRVMWQIIFSLFLVAVFIFLQKATMKESCSRKKIM